ncbi:DUF480 domain-containing protein [Veronia nyctiphanis]|uniref:DUF480 domain-containing protein n=1 Tax=Veronia nyctiphanis TaxID=1278244 RepID=A0A4Q0YTN0_9GAMM|nr:DUF480 domain-containing protein [Veronia nyctiphanis]RXJ74606.1 DUF480 domain-containing protein [Veronia nyctiphanis]
MTVQLTPYQARLIGCLIEKEATTPDQYPLTLNALTNAANQKSSREPVYALSDAEVMDTLDALKKMRLVSDLEGFGSRVTKFQHRFCNTEFGSLQLSEQEKGIVCVMLLRGPQTPGELRTRTNRLCSFADVSEVESVLSNMQQNGLVKMLAREPGKRESRYSHLFTDSDESSPVAVPREVVSKEVDQDLVARIVALEEEVKALREELSFLKEH